MITLIIVFVCAMLQAFGVTAVSDWYMLGRAFGAEFVFGFVVIVFLLLKKEVL